MMSMVMDIRHIQNQIMIKRCWISTEVSDLGLCSYLVVYLTRFDIENLQIEIGNLDLEIVILYLEIYVSNFC